MSDHISVPVRLEPGLWQKAMDAHLALVKHNAERRRLLEEQADGTYDGPIPDEVAVLSPSEVVAYLLRDAGVQSAVDTALGNLNDFANAMKKEALLERAQRLRGEADQAETEAAKY